jgi:hypothetical protein
LTSFFQVSKGDNDIRSVYDGSVGGLNDAMSVPQFLLLTLNAHLKAVEEGTYMRDLYVGQCFLNILLQPSLQPYAGVDFTLYFPWMRHKRSWDKMKNPAKGPRTTVTVWETWLQAAIGLESLSYQAVQGLSFAEEVIRGDCSNPNIVFW